MKIDVIYDEKTEETMKTALIETYNFSEQQAVCLLKLAEALGVPEYPLSRWLKGALTGAEWQIIADAANAFDYQGHIITDAVNAANAFFYKDEEKVYG